MKLKKIASLALAGVMAVSMLAGCAGKTGTDDGTKVEVTTSSIVTALNNGQSADNKAKVTFSDDAAFNAVVAKAIAMESNTTIVDTTVKKNIVTLTGKYGTTSGTTVTPNTSFGVDGTAAVSMLEVYVYDEPYWTESSVVEDAARKADDLISELTADTKEGTDQGDPYYTYTYTGKATVVSVTERDGSTTYYVVGAITRTGVKDIVPNV